MWAAYRPLKAACEIVGAADLPENASYYIVTVPQGGWVKFFFIFGQILLEHALGMLYNSRVLERETRTHQGVYLDYTLFQVGFFILHTEKFSQGRGR